MALAPGTSAELKEGSLKGSLVTINVTKSTDDRKDPLAVVAVILVEWPGSQGVSFLVRYVSLIESSRPKTVYYTMNQMWINIELTRLKDDVKPLEPNHLQEATKAGTYPAGLGTDAPEWKLDEVEIFVQVGARVQVLGSYPAIYDEHMRMKTAKSATKCQGKFGRVVNVIAKQGEQQLVVVELDGRTRKRVITIDRDSLLILRDPAGGDAASASGSLSGAAGGGTGAFEALMDVVAVSSDDEDPPVDSLLRTAQARPKMQKSYSGAATPASSHELPEEAAAFGSSSGGEEAMTQSSHRERQLAEAKGGSSSGEGAPASSHRDKQPAEAKGGSSGDGVAPASANREKRSADAKGGASSSSGGAASAAAPASSHKRPAEAAAAGGSSCGGAAGVAAPPSSHKRAAWAAEVQDRREKMARYDAEVQERQEKMARYDAMKNELAAAELELTAIQDKEQEFEAAAEQLETMKEAAEAEARAAQIRLEQLEQQGQSQKEALETLRLHREEVEKRATELARGMEEL